MKLRALLSLGLVALAFQLSGAAQAAPALEPVEPNVYRATLGNGLRVFIVHNALAPAVATDMAYLVGSRDDPSDVPGMAHAQEHMMFRGTKNLTTAELGTLATALGGEFNASTSDTLTQFQFTVPATDLDAVLHVESDRMRDILDAQTEWQNERGAIEQEVASHVSSPSSRLFQDLEDIALAGTPYAHDGVGTKAAFDALTGTRLKAFYEKWYSPENAVFVIAGNVDPQATLAAVSSYFDSIPKRAVAQHLEGHPQPLRRTVLRRSWPLIYPYAVVGYRMPGVNSKDFLPSFVLLSILDAQRGPIRPLAVNGEALDAEFMAQPYVPEAQLAYASAALNPGSDPYAMTQKLERLVGNYVKNGIPKELFETTKRQLIEGQELSRNSLDSLASDWATTVADDREPSISHEQQLIAEVSLADVDRVAREYLVPEHAIVAAITPSSSASHSENPAPARQGPENPLGTQPASHLPQWAGSLLDHPSVPPFDRHPESVKLDNGITLIVQHETISNAVFLFGRVRSNADLQEPQGKEGITSLLDSLYQYGTKDLDQAAFQLAEDDADAQINAGTEFALQSTPGKFARGVELLAQNELTPRFASETFGVAKNRTLAELQTTLQIADNIAMQRANEKLLPAGDPGLRRPSLQSVNSITLDDVRAYHDAVMRPDLATIVVVGNISTASAQAAVEKAFGGWHASGPVPQLDLPDVPLNAAGDVSIQIPITQTVARFIQMVPLSSKDPDFYPLTVGDAILGGGSSSPDQSRLFRDLRQNAGLVYNVSSSLSGAREKRSEFRIEFASDPQNVERISRAIDHEIEQLQTEPAGDFELGLVKASLVRREIVGTASVGGIGGSLLNSAAEGLPLDQDERDAKAIVGIDSGAIRDAFKKYIHPENFVRLIEGP